MQFNFKPTRIAAASVAAIFAMSALPASAMQTFSVSFTQINGTGSMGTANLVLNDDATSLTVQILASGMDPGGPHLAHIHGLFSEVTTGTPVNSTTPTLANDTDGDGFIELAEGLPAYGPIIIDFGNVDPDLDGEINFLTTLDLLDPSIYTAGYDREDLLGLDLMSLNLREIVVHGLNVLPGPGAGTPGEVNGTNGFLVLLPVLSGEIETGGAGVVPEPGTWAMLIVGFGAIGMSMRSTRRRSLARAIS